MSVVFTTPGGAGQSPVSASAMKSSTETTNGVKVPHVTTL
jgi:hypothetical protein